MASKRKRDDDKLEVHSADALRKLLSSVITTYEASEIAILHIRSLQQVLPKNRIHVSFSNVKYTDIAPLVGLNPNRNVSDIETFCLHRSRIPTRVFKTIVQDIDAMMAQYGPPIGHDTEEARSRFLAPTFYRQIFNRLIPVFGFALRNFPESTIEGRITTKGRVEYYFKALGLIAVLIMETKLNIGEGQQRLDAIAQVIAECDACEQNNAQKGFHLLVYGILCDRGTFEFFLFDATTKPFSFKIGLGPNDPPTCQTPFQLPKLAGSSTARPFINTLHPICEMIFDLLLSSYISSLKAYHNHSVNNTREGQPRKSLDKWEEAMSAAVQASRDFRYAEELRQTQRTKDANLIAEEAMGSLGRSVDALPDLCKPESIISGWDDEEIEKV